MALNLKVKPLLQSLSQDYAILRMYSPNHAPKHCSTGIYEYFCPKRLKILNLGTRFWSMGKKQILFMVLEASNIQMFTIYCPKNGQRGAHFDPRVPKMSKIHFFGLWSQMLQIFRTYHYLPQKISGTKYFELGALLSLPEPPSSKRNKIVQELLS